MALPATMTYELPWLMRPTDADRAELIRPRHDEGLPEVARLQALAGRDWDEGELRAIGRRLRKALVPVAGDWRASAQNAGYSPFSLLIISAATASHLVDAMCATALRAGILLKCRVVEYEEPETWLASNADSLHVEPPDATLLSLDQRSLKLRSAAGDSADEDACIKAAVERVCRLAQQARALTGRAIIVSTIAPAASDPQSNMDAWLDGSPRHLLADYNLRLARAAREHSIALFDVAGIATLVGQRGWDAGRYGYVAKYPFAPQCIPLYAHRLVQLVAAMQGRSRRVLVLDLDETLWGGVVGDDGLEGILLGPGARGEAYLAIQRMALDYKERGVLLCVASKNTPEIALDVFRRHPEMLIREADLTLCRINWDDKASNLKAMAEALDLGLDSFVFIDDNPVERKQVRDAFPGVAIPELPPDPAGWVPVIQAAGYFEQVSFSIEDQTRTAYYQANARRSMQAEAISDPRAFLESLQMVMKVARFEPLGRARIAQLIAKSNQFNLTTRRYSEGEVAALEEAPDVATLQVRLEDMFGDNGMISVVICRKHAHYWDIDTWIMSCRVLGRGVEQAVLGVVADHARAAGAGELRGRYIPTAKNGIVRDHYAKLGFTKTDETASGESSWSLALQAFAKPDVPIVLRELVVVA